METDICVCGEIRIKHPVLSTAPTGGCIDFTIDRKATWHAERDRPRPRGRRVLAISICSVCKSPRGPFQRVGADMIHVGCPGPRATLAAGAEKKTFTMPSSR